MWWYNPETREIEPTADLVGGKSFAKAKEEAMHRLSEEVHSIAIAIERAAKMSERRCKDRFGL